MYNVYKHMSIRLTFILLFISMSFCFAKAKTKTSVKDFKKLEGFWKGSLTYLDYSSGKPYTMPADVTIRSIKKTNRFVFSNMYPNETSANSSDTLIISIDGKYIDNELVKSSKKLSNGAIEIITEASGNDGNDQKAANFRHTYTFSKTTFSIRKDVQFIGEKDWIKRHEYSYAKKH